MPTIPSTLRGNGKSLAITLVVLLVLLADLPMWLRPALEFHQPEVRPASFLQIVAHPDDDLFFINPALTQSIHTGQPVTTVYLMAGEADGRNGDEAPIDYAGYAAARQEGVRKAYSQMLTGTPNGDWQRTAEDGHEVATLRQVTLIFLSMRVADSPRLERLRKIGGTLISTLVPTNSPVAGTRTYNRVELTAALRDIITRYRPTVVRTLDPEPGESYPDHRDHMVAAQLANDAVGKAVRLEFFRGYYNKFWPGNLSPVAYRAKLDLLGLYGGYDLNVGIAADRKEYGRSTAPRYPGTTTWSRLPQPLKVEGVWPHVEVAGNRAFVVRAEDHTILTSVAPFKSWASLGTAEGMPYAAAGPDGRVHLFVAHRGAISYRTMDAAGVWSPWNKLRSEDPVQEGLGVTVDGAGRVRVVAASGKQVLVWTLPNLTPKVLAREAVSAPLSAYPQGVVYRQGATGYLMHVTWEGKRLNLGGVGGYGGIALQQAKCGLIVATRNDAGSLSIGVYSGREPAWTTTGGLFIGSPSIDDGGVWTTEVDGQAARFRALPCSN